MTLIKSISGIRGTIGGKAGNNLTPVDVVKFTAAFANFLQNYHKKKNITLIIGRDARISGEMVSSLISSTLIAMGIDVIDTGLSTTPTVEFAVIDAKADGGIIITASHNPKQWNALKLLNHKGEFISASEGQEVLALAEKESFEFAEINNLGSISQDDTYIEKHIEHILELPLVNCEAIEKAKFSVSIDCVNSTGGIALPLLLKSLGVRVIYELYTEPTGIFPHNPEPLPEHLTEIASMVTKMKADVGFVVDPDVDRLAIVTETGDMFGEEYTLVSIADYILSHKKGNTVSNLSSTRALQDISEKHGVQYNAAAVGEVNVVQCMKETDAIIGGEGNGGVIYPASHYGRDALVGIALFLSHLATSKKTCSALRQQYPSYYMAKNKIELDEKINVDHILDKIKEKYAKYPINDIDGVKIIFDKEWVHLRKSNTEPIIRIYAESDALSKAEHLAKKIIQDIGELTR